ncbi:MAG TPA: OmpA family protein [Polyangiaceae bacterium]|nr:OmpA family protein [Polyangiaceae bacterium]
MTTDHPPPARGMLRFALPAALLALAPSARAQPRVPESNGPGLDTHLFRPAVDSKGFLSQNGSETLGHLDFALGLINDYGHDAMRLEGGHGADALVRHSFQSTLLFNLGLFNRFMVGVQLPVGLMDGRPARQIGPAGALYDSGQLQAQQVPHVNVVTKLRLTRNDQVAGLAIVAQAGIPADSGAPRDLGGEPGAWFWPQLAVEKSIGPQAQGLVRFGLNLGYRFHTEEGTTRFDQLSGGRFESTQGKFTGGAAVSYRVLPPLDLVAELYGTRQAGGDSDGAVALSAEAIGGLKIFTDRRSFLMLGGGVRVTDGFEAASQRALLGFVFEPSIGDSDGDGIKDDEDACPALAEDFDGFQDTRDDSPPGQLGCPEDDNDQDGIPDDEDRCPNQAETRNDYLDDDGCPDVDTRDRDGDGIPDRLDKCPDVPEDRDGFEDQDGCPENDNDRDGIPDQQDACPNEAETVNGVDDQDGCPDKPPRRVDVQENSISLNEKVQFETNSARILPASDPLLNDVASVLKEHPEFTLVEVQGHADERGSSPHNLRLTRDRSRSVLEALAARGVDRRRLRSVGYGKFCPLDPAHNDAAWEKNRRVEFKVVIKDGKRTDVELGCDESKRQGIDPERPAR